MSFSDHIPVFHEFTQTFTEQNLGLRISKINGLAIVQELVKTRHGFKGTSEKSGVRLGALLSAVNGNKILSEGYDIIVSRIRSSARPISLSFRQLYSIDDPGKERCFWQGFLRHRSDNQKWIRLYCILREDGTLCSYSEHDKIYNVPANVYHVDDCTILHGECLSQLAERLLGSSVDDQFVLSNGFTMLVDDKLLIFQADDAHAKIDWISAISVLYVTGKFGSKPKQKIRSLSWGSPPAIFENSRIFENPKISPTQFISKMNPRGEKQSRSATTARCLKQGYLQKRTGSKLWDVSPIHAAKKAIKLHTWNQRWVVLLDDSRLIWHHEEPSDPMGTGKSQLSLRTAWVIHEEKSMLEHLGEEDVSGIGGFPFMLRTGTRLLMFKAKTLQEQKEWVSAIKTVTDPKSNLHPHVAEDVEACRWEALRELQEKPEQLFEDPESAYSLLVSTTGSKGGGCTLEEFHTIAGQHLVPLCDCYTAEYVFEHLVEAPAFMGSSENLDGIQHDSVRTLEDNEDLDIDEIRPIPLNDTSNARLSFDAFMRYTQAMQACLRHGELWGEMRLKLGLDPLETLIKQADYIAEKSQLFGLADGGTMFLTDRHLFFFMGLRQEVRVIPLSSVRDVLLSSTQLLGGVVLQDSITLVGATVHTVLLQGSNAGAENTQRLKHIVNEHKSKAQVCDYKLIFSKLREMLTIGAKAGRRRQIWYEFIYELVEAHHLISSLSNGEEQPLDDFHELYSTHAEPSISKDKSFDTAPYAINTPPLSNCNSEKEYLHTPPDLARTGFKRRSNKLWTKLSAKIRVLLHEDSQGLETYHVHQHGLRLWVAANLIRIRALMRATGRGTSVLLICTKAKTDFHAAEMLEAFLDQEGLVRGRGRTVSFHSKMSIAHGSSYNLSKEANGIDNMDVLSHTGSDTAISTTCDRSNTSVQSVYSMAYSRWLYVLASQMAQAQQLKNRKLQELHNFKPKHLHREFKLFFELVEPMVDGTSDALEALIWWHRPEISFVAMWTLLAPAWHNAMALVPSLLLLMLAIGILLGRRNRSVEESQNFSKAEISKKVEKTDNNAIMIPPSKPPTFPPVNSRRVLSPSSKLSLSLRSGIVFDKKGLPDGGNALFASVRSVNSDLHYNLVSKEMFTSGVGEMKNSPVAGPKPAGAPGQSDGLLKRMKEMQVKAGSMQATLHDYNVNLLKLRSLMTWTEPTRTKILVMMILLVSIVLALVPLRFVWACGILFIFTKPLRSPEKGFFEKLLDEFWRGLPVDSSAHTNLDMAAIYSLQDNDL